MRKLVGHWLVRHGTVAAMLAAVHSVPSGYTRAEVLVGVKGGLPQLIGATPVLIDFNGQGAGGTSAAFAVTSPKSVVVSFDAECKAPFGATKAASLNVAVRLDLPGPTGPFPIIPGDPFTIFCSSVPIKGGGDLSVSSRSSMVTSLLSLPVGTHTLSVRAFSSNPDVTFTLSKPALTVFD